MRITTFARWAVCAALFAPVVASADNDPNTNTKDQPSQTTRDKTTKTADSNMKLTDNEMQVLAHVHHVNQMEIDLGRLAEKRGGTQAVRNYGQMLVKDHTQADKDITAFASKHKQKITAEKPMTEQDRQNDKDAQASIAKLRNMKAADFDRDFLNMMVTDHEREVSRIDSEMANVTDADLKKMLTDIKPVLQKHADEARDLQKSNAQAAK